MQVLASQLPFLANRNAELAVPPLFWPVNCIKIGGHVALLSGRTVYTLYCACPIARGGVSSFIPTTSSKGMEKFRLFELLFGLKSQSVHVKYNFLVASM